MPIRINFSPRIAYGLWLGLIYGLMTSLFFVDWERGIERGIVCLGLLMLILIGKKVYEQNGFRFKNSSRTNTVSSRWSITIILSILTVGMALQFSKDYRNNQISLDQGIITANANRLLLMGINPYDSNHMVDTTAWLRDLPARTALGYGPLESVSVSDFETMLQSYNSGENFDLRNQLLPNGLPKIDWLPPWNGKEIAGLGYKYGPVILVLSLPFVTVFGVAGITLLNSILVLLTVIVILKIARRFCSDGVLISLAVLALALDPFVWFNFIQRSATDIYAIFFIALAVLAWLDGRRLLVGFSLALALGSKTAPTLVVLPLLLTCGWVAMAIFIAALAVLTLPWIVWNGTEFFRNEVLWGILTQPDSTAWKYFVSPTVGQIVTILLAIAMAVLWVNFLWIQKDRARQRVSLIPLLVLQSLLLIAGGNMFHNNYVPWFSLWVPIVGLIWMERDNPFQSETSISKSSRIRPVQQ